MAANALPTLSPLGWVTSPADKADFLISHFYESDKAQSYLYGRNITNLQWLMATYGHDIGALCQNIRIEFEAYLGRYYDSATVECFSNDDATNPTNTVTLQLRADVVQEGRRYAFGRLLQMSNSSFVKVMDLVNNERITG